MSSIRDWQAAMDQPLEPLPPIDRHRAALTVVERAHDTDDARMLLAALGLEDA